MKLDDSIGFLINCTGRKLTQLLASHFQPFDITPEQWSVLNGLGERDGISQKELAKRVEKDQTNVTRILDQLERKSLINRMPNKDDRRSFLPYLTDDGKMLIEKLAPIEDEVMALATQNLSGEQLAVLKQILSQIADDINQHSGMER